MRNLYGTAFVSFSRLVLCLCLLMKLVLSISLIFFSVHNIFKAVIYEFILGWIFPALMKRKGLDIIILFDFCSCWSWSINSPRCLKHFLSSEYLNISGFSKWMMCLYRFWLTWILSHFFMSCIAHLDIVLIRQFLFNSFIWMLDMLISPLSIG